MLAVLVEAEICKVRQAYFAESIQVGSDGTSEPKYRTHMERA
jgi:hypothetical protein